MVIVYLAQFLRLDDIQAVTWFLLTPPQFVPEFDKVTLQIFRRSLNRQVGYILHYIGKAYP